MPTDPQPTPEIETLDSRVVYRNRWISVREDRIRRANGVEGSYGVVDRADFALVLPWQDGGFHLVSQYRYPIRRRCWEFPQGAWEHRPDVDPAELARAELAEETGLRAGRIEPLGHTYSAPGLLSQGCHVFLATDLTAGPTALEPEEFGLHTRWYAEADLWDLVGSGRFPDNQSLAGLALLARFRAR